MRKLLMFLCVIIMIGGCTTFKSMQMPIEECSKIESSEGIVVGSVIVKGGKDLLGRTKWRLKAIGSEERRFVVIVHRDGPEEIFVSKLPAGDYWFYALDVPYGGWSVHFGEGLLFSVEPGETIYIGRLVVDFGKGLLWSGGPGWGKKVRIYVEDAKAEILKKAGESHGELIQGVTTRLMVW